MDTKRMEPTEAELFHRMIGGGPLAESAGRRFMDTVGKRLYWYCFHRLEHVEDARESAQTVLERALERKIEAPVEAKHFRGWLFGMARSVCVDRLRSPKGKEKRIPDLPIVYRGAGPATQVRVKDEHAHLERALGRLPAEVGRAVQLRFGEGKGVDTIARILAVPGHTVRRWLKRALAVVEEWIRRRRDGL